MPRTLPVEVQLIVLECAIASLDAHTFEFRQSSLNSFSLVHRNWTRMAQQELFQTLSLDLTRWVDPVDEVKTRLDIAERHGIVVRSLKLSSLPTSRDRELMENEAYKKLAPELQQLDSLKLELTYAPPALGFFKDLKRLHFYFRGEDAPFILRQDNFLVASSLTHLHVEDVMLADVPLLPHLDTLILKTRSFIHPRAAPAIPNLATLRWDITPCSLYIDDRRSLFDTRAFSGLANLQNLELLLGEHSKGDSVFSKLSDPSLSLPLLSSLTFYLAESVLVDECVEHALKAWCEAGQISLNLIPDFNLTNPVDPFLIPHAHNYRKPVQS
ncbi:hypothetical protein JCM10207_001473 [Rhodosporidiobolus poonsookiae]